jgi:hypothetical protein
MVVEHFRPTFTELDSIVTRLKDAGTNAIIIFGTPPAKADLSNIVELLAKSEFFRHVAEQRGIEIDNTKITPSVLRLKLWQVLQDMMREIARKHGAIFLPVPEITRDKDGYLKKEFSANDSSHANIEYGRHAISHIVAFCNRINGYGSPL